MGLDEAGAHEPPAGVVDCAGTRAPEPRRDRHDPVAGDADVDRPGRRPIGDDRVADDEVEHFLLAPLERGRTGRTRRV